LAQALKAATAMRSRFNPSSVEWESIDHLLHRMEGLKRQSIARTLVSFIVPTIERHPALGDRTDLIRKLKVAYETRSQLVHDGVADNDDVDKQLAFLGNFVPKVLEVLYTELAQRPGSTRVPDGA
jgi:hypothetical protein